MGVRMRKTLLNGFFNPKSDCDWESRKLLDKSLSLIAKDSEFDLFKEVMDRSERLKKELSNS